MCVWPPTQTDFLFFPVWELSCVLLWGLQEVYILLPYFPSMRERRREKEVNSVSMIRYSTTHSDDELYIMCHV